MMPGSGRACKAAAGRGSGYNPMTMSKPPSFAEVVEVIDAMSPEEQEELAAIVRSRAASAKQERFVQGVLEAQAEYAAGKGRAMTVEEIMREALAEGDSCDDD